MTALDCKAYLSKLQPLIRINFTKKVYTRSEGLYNYDSNRRPIMGIHYDYKSTRGDKKMRKQQEREQRRRRKKKNNVHKSGNTIPEDVVLTMDMLTDPNR